MMLAGLGSCSSPGSGTCVDLLSPYVVAALSTGLQRCALESGLAGCLAVARPATSVISRCCYEDVSYGILAMRRTDSKRIECRKARPTSASVQVLTSARQVQRRLQVRVLPFSCGPAGSAWRPRPLRWPKSPSLHTTPVAHIGAGKPQGPGASLSEAVSSCTRA